MLSVLRFICLPFVLVTYTCFLFFLCLLLFISLLFFFFLMIRRPPRSTLDRSSAASDVYKRQGLFLGIGVLMQRICRQTTSPVFCYLPALCPILALLPLHVDVNYRLQGTVAYCCMLGAVSYTHLRAHETVLDLVCRLLLEKKKQH